MAVTRVFAHRGSAGQAPENSVGAFCEARRQGADGVELDVRRSRDGALVVFHDPLVEGMGAICELAVAELPEEIPLLDAALEACAGMVVNVEIKNDPAEGAYEDPDRLAAEVVARALELAPLEELLFSSFDLATLEAVRRADAEVATGWLLGFGRDPVALLPDALERRFDALHPFVLFVSAPLVEAAHGVGLAVNAWTVNAEHDLEAMVRLGVDAVITDDVALARSVVDRPPEGPG